VTLRERQQAHARMPLTLDEFDPGR